VVRRQSKPLRFKTEPFPPVGDAQLANMTLKLAQRQIVSQTR
jgi:hypothetical protein